MDFGFTQLSAVSVLIIFNLVVISLVFFLPRFDLTLYVATLVSIAVAFSLVLKWYDLRKQS
jgi:hypothetical protein